MNIVIKLPDFANPLNIVLLSVGLSYIVNFIVIRYVIRPKWDTSYKDENGLPIACIFSFLLSPVGLIVTTLLLFLKMLLIFVGKVLIRDA